MKKAIACAFLAVPLISSFGQGGGTNITITGQPQSQSAPAGGTVSFTVAATGPGPLFYQWQFNGTNLPAFNSNSIITTIAGDGTYSFSGDGGSATNASFQDPWGVAVDPVGDVFIVDNWNNRVREVDTNGIITTVAGDGTNGYAGDGDYATNAELALSDSWGLGCGTAADAYGNLLIADGNNYRVREVTADGFITTVAGNGSATDSGDGGAAINAGVNIPSGVAVDAAGNLFFAEYGGNVIRKVDTSGTITTVAGNGSSGYSGDGGPATNATLNHPEGVAVDAAGNLYVADYINERIRRIDTNGIITTVAGNGRGAYSGDGGAATNASIDGPVGVAADGFGDLLIVDNGNNRIREVNAAGVITTVAGGGNMLGDGGTADHASLSYPGGVALDEFGDMFIADTHDERIRTVPSLSNPTLFLSNLSGANAGNYTVIVGNSSQSVTSSVAVLQIMPTIMINGVIATGAVQSVASAQVAILGNFPNGFVFYTLDGTVPTTSSTLYSGPFTLTNSAVVQALNLSEDFSQNVLSAAVAVQIVPVFTLQTSVIGSGKIIASPTNAPYVSNSVVVLTAVPATNWAFSGWAGGVSGNQNPLSVTMDGPLSVQASFVATNYPLTVGSPGGGNVTVNGQTISPATYYPTGSVVSLNAIPASGWTFLGWQGTATGTNNPLSVTIYQTNSIEAEFGTVVNTVADGGGSVVLSQMNPIPFGTSLVASAAPNPGQFFVTWSEAAAGTNSPTTMTITNPNPEIYALFSALPPGKYALNVVVNGSGTVSLNPRQSYHNPGDLVTLTASTTNAGTKFYGWSQGAAGKANPLDVIVTSNMVIQAYFVESILPPALIVTRTGGAFTISWSEASLPYQLQSSTNSASASSWIAVTNVPVNSNGQLSVTLPISGPQRLFRLQATP